MLRLLTFIVDAFVAAMGITAPRPEQRRVVSLALGGFLLVLGLAAIAVVTFMVWRLRGP